LYLLLMRWSGGARAVKKKPEICRAEEQVR
jgi:hypothetical protein